MLIDQKAMTEGSDEWKALEEEILGFDVRTIKARFGDECDQVRYISWRRISTVCCILAFPLEKLITLRMQTCLQLRSRIPKNKRIGHLGIHSEDDYV